MRCRLVFVGMVAGLVALLATPAAEACHTCRRSPCVYVAVAPAPQYQCVTEMVPYTVPRQKVHTEFQTVTETIMVRKPVTTFVERQRVVCKPVFDTQYIQRTVQFCRTIPETTLVDQQYTVCKPVITPQQICEYLLQPMTQVVNVAVPVTTCGHCGKARTVCVCQPVLQTCYVPVPVTKTVNVTTLVPEIQTRKVPVTTYRTVVENKVENIPVRSCRIVQEVVTDRIPITHIVCEPQTITRRIPYPVCETVYETCYRPVTHLVPIACAPAPVVAPAASPAPAPTPTSQQS